MSEWKVRRSGGWISVKCMECWTVSPKGGAIQRPGGRFTSMAEVGAWVDAHEHTDIRTEREAKAAASARRREYLASKEGATQPNA